MLSVHWQMAVLLWQEQSFIEPVYIHCSFSSPGSSLFVRCVVVTLSLFSTPLTNISFQKLACCRGRSDVMQATLQARTPWLSTIISPKWWRHWPYCLSRSPSLTPPYYRYHPKAVWCIVIGRINMFSPLLVIFTGNLPLLCGECQLPSTECPEAGQSCELVLVSSARTTLPV